MKFRAPFVLFPVFLLPLTILADEIELESAITQVSLFRDGALVTREGTVNVPAGKSILVFKNLPSQVDTSALQTNFLDATNGLIRNAKIFRPEERQESDIVKAIRDRLDTAKKDKERQQRLQSEAKANIAFATAMRESFAAEFGKIDEGQSLSLDQARELNAFAQQTQTDAYKTIDQSELAIREIDERIQEIETELREAVETAALLSSIAEVEIEMDSASEVGIALSYLANNARWVPQYELRASPDRGSLDFGYFASVWQRTGENWSDITLSLQTNQASRQGNVPEPPPLVVRKREDTYRRRAVLEEGVVELSPFSVSADKAEGYSATETISGTRLSQQQVAVTASTVSFQATIPGQITVPSSKDSSAYKVLEESIEAEFWSESVPRLQLDAYLRAKLKNTLPLPILPGRALAFVDGKLSSKVFLDKILPDEETEISLGVDGNIAVKRTEGAQKDSDSGFIDKTTTLKREYRNSVVNQRNVAHKVIIVDQFPISQNSKIEIRRIAPKDSDVVIDEENENNGIFQWEAVLQPKAERTFVTAYDVVYPRDWNIAPEL